jgi:hypothetical protein
MWHIPALAWNIAIKASDWSLSLRPKRPRLQFEIRQVCFDKILASVEADWSDYTIDLYLFIRVWVVNRKETQTTIKQWSLAIIGDQKAGSEHVEDISRWHQHTKVQEQQHGMTVVRDIRKELDALPNEALRHGIPVEGWICFLIRQTREAVIKKGYIILTVTDSFGHKYRVTSKGPWPCKGDMVNPKMLY